MHTLNFICNFLTSMAMYTAIYFWVGFCQDFSLLQRINERTNEERTCMNDGWMQQKYMHNKRVVGLTDWKEFWWQKWNCSWLKHWNDSWCLCFRFSLWTQKSNFSAVGEIKNMKYTMKGKGNFTQQFKKVEQNF